MTKRKPQPRRRASGSSSSTGEARPRAAETDIAAGSGLGRRHWIGGVAVLIAVALALALGAFLLLDHNTATAPVPSAGLSAHATATPAGTQSGSSPATQAPLIDGIPCNQEDVTYHEHAHLEIVARGTQVTVPANTGIVNNSCLYWLHTHDTSGEIHMEAPHARAFTLGEFFDVWHQSLSPTLVAGVRVASGESIRTFVDLKPYHGNLRAIPLHRHTLVTIEIGPPFTPPSGFDFQGD